MIIFNSLLLFLAYASFIVANGASGNEFEQSFDMFMANFTAEVRQKAASISYEQLHQLKAENDGQIEMSDSEVIQESDHFIQQKIDLFRAKAQQTFLDAITNSYKNYYVFNTDRSLWHKPDQDFEKVLFNGTERNIRIFQERLADDLQQTFYSDSSPTDLEKRNLAFARINPGFTRSFIRGTRKAFARFFPSNTRSNTRNTKALILS